jgi:hypothetical protein
LVGVFHANVNKVPPDGEHGFHGNLNTDPGDRERPGAEGTNSVPHGLASYTLWAWFTAATGLEGMSVVHQQSKGTLFLFTVL